MNRSGPMASPVHSSLTIPIESAGEDANTKGGAVGIRSAETTIDKNRILLSFIFGFLQPIPAVLLGLLSCLPVGAATIHWVHQKIEKQAESPFGILAVTASRTFW